MAKNTRSSTSRKGKKAWRRNIDDSERVSAF